MKVKKHKTSFYNKARTNLLIIANEEFKTMKKSKMQINTMTPEELIKMYEQNYFIQFKQQESPVSSKTSKKRAAMIGQVSLDKSISILEDGSVLMPQKRNVIELKKISVAERKLFKDSANHFRSSVGGSNLKILNESMASNYQSLYQSNKFKRPFRLSDTDNANKIFTKIEKETKEIQDSFDKIQTFCSRFMKQVVLPKHQTGMKYDEELFDMLSCKEVNYDKKLVSPGKNIPDDHDKRRDGSRDSKDKVDLPKASLFQAQANYKESKESYNIPHIPDPGDKNDFKLQLIDSQKKSKQPKPNVPKSLPKAPKSTNTNTITFESLNNNKINKLRDGISPKAKNNNNLLSNKFTSVVEEADAEAKEGQEDIIYSKNDYTNNIEEIDIMNNSQSGSQISEGLKMDDMQTFNSQLSQQVNVEINKEGFCSQNSDILFDSNNGLQLHDLKRGISSGLQFDSNNASNPNMPIEALNRGSVASSMFGSNLLDFGTINKDFGSNLSDAKGINEPLFGTISREGSSNSAQVKNARTGAHKNTFEFLMGEYQTKNGDGELAAEILNFKKKVEEENDKIDTSKDNNLANFDSTQGQELYKSDISENSFVFNNDAFKSEL